MSDADQRPLGFVLLKTSQVESPKAHIVFHIPEGAFGLDTTLLPQGNALLGEQVVLCLLAITLQFKTLCLDKIRNQRYCRGDHDDYSAADGKVFLEFVIRKFTHELPVVGQSDQVIKDQRERNSVDRLRDDRNLEQR